MCACQKAACVKRKPSYMRYRYAESCTNIGYAIRSEKCTMLKSQYSAYTIMLASHGRTFSKVTFYLLWAVMVRLRHCLLSVNISFTF